VLGGGAAKRVEPWSEGTGVQKHTAHASEWWCVVRSGPPCGGKAGERQSGRAAPRAAACGGAAPRAAACGGAATRAAAPAGYGPRPMLELQARPWPGPVARGDTGRPGGGWPCQPRLPPLRAATVR
jgi:hypothetical protein